MKVVTSEKNKIEHIFYPEGSGLSPVLALIYNSSINRSGIRCSYITSSCFYDLNLHLLE
jgi:hypothetical protein